MSILHIKYDTLLDDFFLPFEEKDIWVKSNNKEFIEVFNYFSLGYTNDLGFFSTISIREKPKNDLGLRNWLTNSELLGLTIGVSNKILTSNFNFKSFEESIQSIERWNRQSNSITEFLDFWKPTFLRNKNSSWFGCILGLSPQLKLGYESEIYTIIQELYRDKILVHLSFENDLNIEKYPNVYLQVSLDDFNHQNHPSVMTISKSNFNSIKVKTSPKNKYYSWIEFNKLFSAEIEELGVQFYNDLKSFHKYYQAFKKIELNRIEFIAIVLDLYNRNRNEESLELDDNLKKTIRNTINRNKQNSDFNYDLTLATVVKNIIKINAEDYNLGSPINTDKYHVIFSEKRVFKKIKNIYDKSIGSEKIRTEKFNSYLRSQTKAYTNIIEKFPELEKEFRNSPYYRRK